MKDNKFCITNYISPVLIIFCIFGLLGMITFFGGIFYMASMYFLKVGYLAEFMAVFVTTMIAAITINNKQRGKNDETQTK
jgi:hypothetical protein